MVLGNCILKDLLYNESHNNHIILSQSHSTQHILSTVLMVSNDPDFIRILQITIGSRSSNPQFISYRIAYSKTKNLEPYLAGCLG